MNMSFVASTMSPSSANKMEDFIQQQQLGLPESLLFYLKKNANPRFLLKLMQISKYFCFKEFPFFVVDDLKFDLSEWEYRNFGFYYRTLDLENLTKPIWVTNTMNCYADSDVSKIISRLLPKIAVCDIVNLELEHQIVTLDEFKILTSSGKIKKVYLRDSHVEDANGEVVPFEKIIELLPMIKDFECWLDPEAALTFTHETAQNIVNFLNLSTLSSFRLRNIPASFDFMTFAKFMDANSSINYFLNFSYLIPHEYSKMLQEYVDKLLEKGFSQYRSIRLQFPGQTRRSMMV